MDEREARELVSNLSYYEKLILLKGLVPTRSERGQNDVLKGSTEE